MSEEMKPLLYTFRNNDSGWVVSAIKPDSNWDIIEPLYTKEQLQPRVKMTQAEFNEFNKLLSVGVSTIYDVFELISEDRGETDEFENLYDRLFENSTSEQAVSQLEFARLWADFNGLHPEETIEIIPEKKWFVRSKLPVKDGWYKWLLELSEDDFNPRYNLGKFVHKWFFQFDTKEQAEEWTNPLTEAVLLPVGDE